MHFNKPARHLRPTNSEAANTVLREAKRLHRAATAESLATSLAVLRRLLSSNTLHDLSLPELRQRRGMVQRKHILRMLAIEAGFTSWEQYRLALAHMTTRQLEHFDIAQREAGYLNIWFSSRPEAQEHAAQHGGRALSVGQHAVVFVDIESAK